MKDSVELVGAHEGTSTCYASSMCVLGIGRVQCPALAYAPSCLAEFTSKLQTYVSRKMGGQETLLYPMHGNMIDCEKERKRSQRKRIRNKSQYMIL